MREIQQMPRAATIAQSAVQQAVQPVDPAVPAEGTPPPSAGAERLDGLRRWRPYTILSGAVLEPLYELNREYLQTLARMPRHWHVATHERLPDPVCLTLMSLEPQRRALVARCPFSLFSARFHDDGFWLRLANPAAVCESDAHGDPGGAPLTHFAQAALFFAWHLAQSNPAAARVVFGMSPLTLGVFNALTLTRLQHIAREHPDVIVPRWPERSGFWRTLLDVAPRTPEQCVSEAHLVGLQMLAAELPANQERRASLRTSRP